MATLKEFLEERMMDESLLRRVLVKEASLNENEKKHFKLKIKKVETGEVFDTHECIVSAVSDEDIVPVVGFRNIILLMRLIEEPFGHLNETPYPHIIKVIDTDRILSEDKKQMELTFLIVNNIER